MGERIRLRYVGLVNFIDKIVGMLGGLVFTILVIRRLSTDDFGTWQWISRILGYAVIPVTIMNFWVWRFVARDHTNSKTGLVMNSILSLPVLFIYLMVLPALAGPIQATAFPFLLAAALIPLNYMILTLWNIGGGIKPQDPAYCEMAYEAVRTVSAFILVFFLGLALVGAILSFELASLAQLALFVILLRKYLHGPFKKNVAKQWITYSWLSTYVSQSGILIALDAAMVVFMFAGSLATAILAYFGVASTVGIMVGLAAGFSYALTPKLIRGGKASDVETVLKLTMLFGIPMLIGTLIIARPLVYLFGATYLVVVPIAMILSVNAFSDLISSIADNVLTGTVDVDKGKPKFKELAKSRLFLSPSINLIMGALYLVTLYLLLAHFVSGSPIDPQEITFLWATSLLAVKLPFVLLKVWYARRVMRFSVPYKEIGKYCLGAVVMGIVLLVCLQYVTYYTSIYQFIIYPLVLVGIGGLVYFSTMFVIDRDFRQLARSLLLMMKGSKPVYD